MVSISYIYCFCNVTGLGRRVVSESRRFLPGHCFVTHFPIA